MPDSLKAGFSAGSDGLLTNHPMKYAASDEKLTSVFMLWSLFQKTRSFFFSVGEEVSAKIVAANLATFICKSFFLLDGELHHLYFGLFF